MAEPARITVTRGPDRGKVFELEDDLIHIGSGPGNQVALSDQTIAEHQASIVSRNGRYAIYTPMEESVGVDGSAIPAERWIWLPSSALVKVSERTEFELTYEPSAPEPTDHDSVAPLKSVTTETEDESFEPQPKAKAKAKSKKRDRGKRARGKDKGESADKNRQVARFVTNQGGDSLVKLGEDGNLPELTLMEAGATAAKQKKQAGSNPVMLYVGVGFSMLMTIALLFVDVDDGEVSQSEKSRALQMITEFHGQPGQEIQPYQALLREAQRARSVRDFERERKRYQDVLALLNAEDNSPITGLTGDPRNDDKLRGLIGTLISD